MNPAITSGQFVGLPDGIRLHYASSGSPGKPLLVFLHGFPEFGLAWEEILPEFGGSHYAVAPDLRGYNLSSAPREVEAYRLVHIAQDIAELIEALGYERASIIGHDWGGAVGWRVACDHPGRLERLAVINAPHPLAFARELLRNPTQQAASRHMGWLRLPEMEDALTANDFARLRDWLRSMPRVGHAWLTADRLRVYVECWRHGLRGPLNYYRASPLSPAPDSSQATLGMRLDAHRFRVRARTLVLWGMRDESLVPELLDGLEEWVEDLRIERFPAATHWIVHEEPRRVTEHLMRFLGQ